MLKRYLISNTDTELTIIKNPARAKVNFYLILLFTIIWYVALIRGHKSTADSWGFIFYLVPLLLIPQAFKYLTSGFSSSKITFSKNTRTADIYGKKRIKFDDVKKVLVDYPNKYVIDECTLHLVLFNGEKVQIDRSDANFSSEVIQTARSIARVLGVTIEDKHPYEEKL
jgi:hypothetical protein